MPDFSTKTMILNAIVFYSATILGGYILWIKSLPIFLAYSIILIVTVIVCRYFVCSPCFYYGKPCPSFGFSYLAKLFPKAKDKPFNGKAAVIESGIIIVCWLLPVLLLVLSWTGVIDSYSLLEYVLMGIYVALLLGVYGVHQITGCNKCKIKDCPISKSSKIS